jgi:hypothetical protein
VTDPHDRPPVWLLDIDGVLNIRKSAWHAAPRRITLYTDTTEWIIRWAPQLVVRIAALAARRAVEVQWCSTWCVYPVQLRRLEVLTGLPRFASALPSRLDRPVPLAKLEAAQRVLAEGRRLIWTDDDEVPAPDREPTLHAELTAGGRGLLIRPDSRSGLTPEHLDQIEAFIGDIDREEFMSETPYVETEALLAVLNDDEERLAGVLDDMTPGELDQLARHARHLAWSCRKAAARKEELTQT